MLMGGRLCQEHGKNEQAFDAYKAGQASLTPTTITPLNQNNCSISDQGLTNPYGISFTQKEFKRMKRIVSDYKR